MAAENQFYVSEGEPAQNVKLGNVRTASLHIFCAVVGAGVLALPSCIAWMGWIAGPIAIIIFYLISLLFSVMLASLYEVNGVEHSRYHHAVSHILGRNHAIAVSVLQITNIVLVTIAFTITGASAMQQIGKLSCPADKDETECFNQTWQVTLLFGLAQLLLSQIRSLEEAGWLSAAGTIATFPYIIVAFVLSIIDAVKQPKGTITGIETTDISKAFGVLNSLGSIAFAFSVSMIIFEIEDTLAQPPKAATQMKKACNIAISGAAVCYFGVAVAGYAGAGNSVPSIILQAYDSPKWALYLANAGLLINMLSSFQVFAQALFNTVESHIKQVLLARNDKTPGTATIITEGKAADATTTSAATDSGKNVVPSPFNASIETGNSRDQVASCIAARKLGLECKELPSLEERLSAVGSGRLHILASTKSSALRTIDQNATGVGGKTAAGLAIAPAKSAPRGGDMDRGMSSRVSSFIPMYNLDTGLANEALPLNEDGVYAPFWARLVLRSSYVVIITIIAMIMPFFSAFVGLVGAITFWPLTIFFCYAMYVKVFPVSKGFKMLLDTIWWVMLAVAIAATIAACREVVVSWESFEMFG